MLYLRGRKFGKEDLILDLTAVPSKIVFQRIYSSKTIRTLRI